MLGEINARLAEIMTAKDKKDRLSQEIIDDLVSAKTELDAATQNYNFADNNELIDFYTYRIKAAQAKYSLLLKKAKESGISSTGCFGIRRPG